MNMRYIVDLDEEERTLQELTGAGTARVRRVKRAQMTERRTAHDFARCMHEPVEEHFGT